MTTARCHVCGAPAVMTASAGHGLGGVTSDCRPWREPARLGVCRACGTVQKVIDAAWRAGTERIYRDYAIYQQSGGVEQSVFDRGEASSRSVRLLARLGAHVELPARGRLLDIGSGNGALLRAFQQRTPGWSLAGTELDARYRHEVESIPGVEALYTCPPHEVPGTFDLISMVHVLEHIVDPVPFLTGLAAKLAPGGLLLFEVPDYRQNPFDLLIADHCTHFTVETLDRVIATAGYSPVISTGEWIAKEVTLVARKAPRIGPVECPQPADSGSVAEDLSGRLRWLESVEDAARVVADRGGFGLFGTSIAATWLYGRLQHGVRFFVDEDPHRAGRRHMGLPIYPPREVPVGSHVFVALPEPLASSIAHRLEGPHVTYHVPPAFVPVVA